MTPNRKSARDALERASARWPDVRVDPDAFQARVATLEVDDDRLSRYGEDLLLATAVLAGDSAAMAHFDGQFIATACSVARRIDRSESFLDDVAQELRLKLLTGPEPRLARFACVGSLLDWLRVAALRTAINLRRSDHLAVAEEITANVGLEDPPNGALDGYYQKDFQTALEAGFRRLGPRERTLLRLHFVDHLNIERIGVMYGVHRATVARWLVGIRNQLFAEAKAQLATNHGFNTAEVKSLYRHLEGRVHITMSRILKSHMA